MDQFKQNRTQKPFAKKSFGQNFLVDENYIGKIIRALNLQEGETIIEIGAGRGALTEKLVESGAQVIAIELERDMISFLKEKFRGRENFQLIEADALKVDFSALGVHQSAKLVANLPYYISTAILQKLIEHRTVFSEMILMFQKEVVERITAQAGNSDRGFLTVLVENYLSAEKLFDVPPRAFRPAPKVWSSIVRLRPNLAENDFSAELFFKIVSVAFTQKRKTILNNLKNFNSFNSETADWEKILVESEIEHNRRAESLKIEEWKNLLKVLESKPAELK